MRCHYPRFMVWICLAIVAAAIATFAVGDDRLRGAAIATLVHESTCEAMTPLYRQTEKFAAGAYADALDRKGLVRANLEQIRIGHDSGMTMPDVIDASGQRVAEWQTFEYKTKRVLAGRTAMNGLEDVNVELVRDRDGGIWRVNRQPVTRWLGPRVRVKACAWGCWGFPGYGAVMPPYQLLYVLSAGQTYRGEIDIAYDAPSLNLEILDQNCPSPA